ncbi:MAG: hypothetical protein K0Q90_2774 [Paenibacillaceae bacterium]|jgi:hypothetical protein|nr:hypothetical protein [Paenibacillaceae bacterium]
MHKLEKQLESINREAEVRIREKDWECRKGIFTRPPERIPTAKWTDAPLLGNGDMGVAIGGGAEEQTFYMGKSDFWVLPWLGETEQQREERLLADNGRRTGARIITVGQVSLLMPELADAEYRQEQDILHAEVRGRFSSGRAEVELCSWTAAEANVLVTEVECRRGELNLTVRLHAGEKDTDEVFSYDNGAEPGLLWFRYASSPGNLPETRRVAAAVGLTGGQAEYEWRFQNVEASVRLQAGERITIVTALVSSRETPDYSAEARRQVLAHTADDQAIRELKAAHRSWWRGFWSASAIEIGDPVLEKYYYGSYYILGSCIRGGKHPPGLFGSWITTDRPGWTGSYTMNYNYEAPFWGLYAGNRTALADSYCQPLLDFLPWGKRFAREKLGCRGIYMPVELGPEGLICSMFFHGQKSNASFAAVNLLMHIRYTRDMAYARKVYPYLREAAAFWEDYLVLEDGRYVIYDDDIHERSMDKKNPILSLGFIRMLLEALLELSAELELDGEMHGTWRHILKHLSGYPVMERNGRRVFRLTEEGMDWNDRNSLAVQHVYPAGMIGLDSDPALLAIARDTIDEMQRWSDFNAFPTYYATAARVGYDPEILLERLRKECEATALPNLSLHHGGGGIENASAVPVALQEMLLQSRNGVVRLFPVWPNGRTASFSRLRAEGAFVISAGLAAGGVEYAVIDSEQGGTCIIANPWGAGTAAVVRNGRIAGQAKGEQLELETEKGERVILLPLQIGE